MSLAIEVDVMNEYNSSEDLFLKVSTVAGTPYYLPVNVTVTNSTTIVDVVEDANAVVNKAPFLINSPNDLDYEVDEDAPQLSFKFLLSDAVDDQE